MICGSPIVWRRRVSDSALYSSISTWPGTPESLQRVMYDHGSSRAGAGSQVGLIRVIALALRPDWSEAAYLGTTHAGRQAHLTRLRVPRLREAAQGPSGHAGQMVRGRPADICRSTAERVSWLARAHPPTAVAIGAAGTGMQSHPSLSAEEARAGRQLQCVSWESALLDALPVRTRCLRRRSRTGRLRPLAKLQKLYGPA
jgi:hypothetical protein